MRTSVTPSMHFAGGNYGNFLKKTNFTKIESEKRNTYLYMAGEFCYVKNNQGDDIIYLKFKNYQMCDGTAKINVSGEVLESVRAHTCGSRTEHSDHLSALVTMRSCHNSTTTTPDLQQHFIQTCSDVVKRILTYLRCEQILQNARRSNCSENSEIPNDAVNLITQ